MTKIHCTDDAANLRQSSQLDSSNGLSLCASLNNGLSPWVHVVLTKQESTSHK